MLLEIISPDKVIYTGEVQSVRLPGKDGYFEILKDHAPLISLLQAGEIKVVDQNGSTETFNTNKGFVEVVDNKYTVKAVLNWYDFVIDNQKKLINISSYVKMYEDFEYKYGFGFKVENFHSELKKTLDV